MIGIPSDADIARRIVDGAEDAATCEAELCARYLNRARLYGLKHLRFDVTAAEDLSQQVMVVVLQALRAGRVQDLDRIDRFMLGTCRNVAHEMRRAHTRLERTREKLSIELPQASAASTPPWHGVESQRVAECVATLPAREARLLFLLYQQGASAAEAATAMDTTAGNVRVMHHRALKRVRECVGV